MSRAPRIVVLGMMTKMPVAGVVWQTVHYLVGFQRLGFDVYYVEAHARTPSMLMDERSTDGSEEAAAFIDGVMRRFDLADRWAYQALHSDGRVLGMGAESLSRLYRDAALVVNLHGGTLPREEHAASGRLVFLETDPVLLQVELHNDDPDAIAYLEPHTAFFTFGENYGTDRSRLPVSDRFEFRPTRQPVVMEFWRSAATSRRPVFTTIANWQQQWRRFKFDGETYHWDKRREFLKFLDVPQRTKASFELALAGCSEADRSLLERHGWSVRDGYTLSLDLDAYRDYIQGSAAEFTAAKDQNIRFRSGWFSDRSATYLAAGRPVITQDTGFGDVLPVGEGLFAFQSLDDVADAVEQVAAAPARHSRRAREIARESFAHDVVLGRLLDDLDVRPPASTGRPAATRTFRDALRLTPLSRRPLTLPPRTVAEVLAAPLPPPGPASDTHNPVVSIVVVTHNHLAVTRLCLESILAHSRAVPFELVVVDNASTDLTAPYLEALASRERRVRVIRNQTNVGFASAVNQGLAAATANHLVVMNNDVVVAPRWLLDLRRHLADDAVGLVGPVTNRAGTAAEIPTSYETFGDFVRFATRRSRELRGQSTDADMLALFCVATKREVIERVGPLDTRFGTGLFEDDDLCHQVRAAGYVIRHAEDVFVHHFGEASFGDLFADGTYARLFERNRRLFEEKWGLRWQPHGRRDDGDYQDLVRNTLATVAALTPQDARVAVLSRGDAAFVDCPPRVMCHLPTTRSGTYAGHHPADADEAIEAIESARRDGIEYLVFPRDSAWWLTHYDGLSAHLLEVATQISDADHCTVYRLDAAPGGSHADENA
ncbi:MAG: glycosyltransferase [Actinobacteria bacterium]|nr:glycosyltransferase [Actinomycetota bacterium]